jgi:hypothetical protein
MRVFQCATQQVLVVSTPLGNVDVWDDYSFGQMSIGRMTFGKLSQHKACCLLPVLLQPFNRKFTIVLKSKGTLWVHACILMSNSAMACRVNSVGQC